MFLRCVLQDSRWEKTSYHPITGEGVRRGLLPEPAALIVIYFWNNSSISPQTGMAPPPQPHARPGPGFVYSYIFSFKPAPFANSASGTGRLVGLFKCTAARKEQRRQQFCILECGVSKVFCVGSSAVSNVSSSDWWDGGTWTFPVKHCHLTPSYI